MSADRAPRLAALMAQPCPKYEVKSSRKRTAQENADALRGHFEVFGHPVELKPPVDWDPPGHPSFQALLHSWTFLDPLLALAGQQGHREAFVVATGLASDWIAQNGAGGDGLNRYAWADKITGDRSTYLGYLVRLGACKGWLDDREATLLTDAVIRHGNWLCDDANYVAGSNHGLYQDSGLAQLAKYALPFVPEAEAWRTRAIERFTGSLLNKLDEDEAMWPEHSVSYQFNIVTLLRSLALRETIDTPQLRRLHERVAETAGWLVQPDGAMSQIGDTNRQSGERFRVPLDSYGLRFMPKAGWAVVKTADSYLITAATYHSGVHKHADELSFELFESGQRVIADTGKYTYDNKDPMRIHACSAEAHNGLIVDGQGGRWHLGQPRYGSGMLASGAAEGWYAIQARNPLVERQGVGHERLFVYRPGEILVIVDRLESDERHSYERWFHLDPGVRAVTGDGSIRLEGDRFRGSLHDWSGAGRRVVRGQTDPLQGWSCPAERQRVPTDAIVFETVAAKGTCVAALVLSEADVALDAADASSLSCEFAIRVDGRASRLGIRRDGGTLQVAVVR